MLKLTKLLTLLLLFSSATVMAQKSKSPKIKDTSTVKVDTTIHDEEKDIQTDNIAVVTVDDNDQGDGGSQNVSSVLTAGRDPFFSAESAFLWANISK